MLTLTLVAAESQITRLRAEVDRVGASFRKAGAGRYVSLADFGQSVSLTAPSREEPRRSWRGRHSQALELLSALPDDAGVEAVWRALNG